MGKFIAFLRAVNVGGRIVKMAELRILCGEMGWREVATYIQSGNIVFESDGKAQELEAALEKGLEKGFGFAPSVMVRTAAQLRRIAEANPFPGPSEAEPNRVALGLCKEKPKAGSAEAILAKARAGEKVAEAGGELWFHYPNGMGTSKLTPASIDRAAGSPVTARNWRTILKLLEMAES
jgi:uncharacterized protein (DUF1697 family)